MEVIVGGRWCGESCRRLFRAKRVAEIPTWRTTRRKDKTTTEKGEKLAVKILSKGVPCDGDACGARGNEANKCSGQGTVELAAVLPIVLIIAVIAVNACTFFSECAAFDRQARQAVRVHATSLSYGEDSQSAVARVQQTLGGQFKRSNESIDVWTGNAGGGCIRYSAKLNYSPTLFGMGMKSEVFGVSLPQLSHEVQLVVDPYNPSVFFG